MLLLLVAAGRVRTVDGSGLGHAAAFYSKLFRRHALRARRRVRFVVVAAAAAVVVGCCESDRHHRKSISLSHCMGTLEVSV